MSTAESEIQAIMKDLYSNEVPEIGYQDPVALATIKKATNFKGRSKEFAVLTGGSPGTSADIGTAIDNADAEANDYFAVTRRKQFTVMKVDADAFEACSDDGAKIDYIRMCVRTARQTERHRVNRWFYGNGGGAIARLDASAGGGGTATLLVREPADLVILSRRQRLVSSADDGTTGAADANPGIIGSINRRTGTIGISTGSWNASFANSDYLFIEGDYGAVFHGFRAWIPDSDPGATAFFGLDRSTDPMRLGGQRFTAEVEDATLENFLMRIAAEYDIQAGNTRLRMFWNPVHNSQLLRELGNKVEYDKVPAMDSSGKVADVGFKSAMVHCGHIDIEILPDRDAPKHRSFICDPDMMSFEGMGEIARVATYGDDTNQWLRSAGEDAMEGRIVTKGNFVFHAPGHFANCDLTNLTNPA